MLTAPNPLDLNDRPAATPPRRGAPIVVLEARVVSGPGGGPDKTILNSPRYLAPHGYEAICAYMHPPADPGFEQIRGRAQAADAPLVEVIDRGPWDLRVARQLLRVCRTRRVAIWHGHDYKSNVMGLLLRRFWPMRLITTVHGWVHYTRRTPLYYALDRMSLRRYQRVVCVSDDLVQACLSAGVPQERCTLIENAVDVRHFARSASVCDAKQRLGFRTDRLLIGAVGRLSAEKAFDRLIRAVDRLLTAGVDVELVIAGDGDERRRLEQLIDTLGRRDRMRLLGYLADPIDLYQAMDVFALCSLREGLPNVVLEAMALQVPVVASRVAGLPRLIEHEQNGLLVAPGDIGELAAALARCLGDSELRGRLGAHARRTIEMNYSFEARMGKFRNLFDDLMAPCPSGT